MDSAVTVYGTDTCEDTKRTRRHLEELGIEYRYVDLEHDPEADRMVKRLHGGRRITPTVVISSSGRSVTLTEPGNPQLDAELDRLGLLRRPASRRHRPRSRGERRAA